MASLFRAAWVLPIAGHPLREGWVAAENGRILAAGDARTEPPPSTDTFDLGDRAILPGLVNAHTHLELSWMQGLVPPAASMPAWASALISLRARAGDGPASTIDRAIHDARAAGTSLVGDVCNTLAPYRRLAESELAAVVFREILGFNATDPSGVVDQTRRDLGALESSEWIRCAVVPHAPYSVSPELLKAIAAAAGDDPISIHLGESAEEIRFLQDGTGAWRDLLGSLGVWNDRWVPPGCSPVEYLDRLGLVSNKLMAVHCVQATGAELRRLAAAGATVVACPRSNHWTGAGTPPIEDFYGSGVRVAVGTDSLASVEDLSVFAELAELRRLAPRVPAARLLESATRAGAGSLGFGADFGTIERGKRAELLAVRVPSGVDDVEEYLVSGIEPDSITWLDPR